MVHLSKKRSLVGTYNKLKAKKIGIFPITKKINDPGEWKISRTFNVKDLFEYYPLDVIVILEIDLS